MSLDIFHQQKSNFLRHDIAATCVLKMPLNPNHPSIQQKSVIFALFVCLSVCHIPLIPFVHSTLERGRKFRGSYPLRANRTYTVSQKTCDYIFTARCTLVQSAVLRSHVVCLSVCPSVCPSVRPSVCDVGEL